MARRKKAGELRGSENECPSCNMIIPGGLLRCTKCNALLPAAKKMAAFLVVVIVVLAGMSYIIWLSMDAHDPFGEKPTDNTIETPDNPDPDTPDPTPDNPSTDGRTIVFELKEADAPNTCANVKKYVQDGFYSGLIFHRVIDGFMIQGGGFYPGMTEKQPTYPPINLEISPNLRHIDGAVAMARTNDPNSATSQFYICDGPQDFLNDNYAVFGQVTSGMDVVRAISAVQTGTASGQSDVPLSDVKIISASLSTSGGKTYVTLVVDF